MRKRFASALGATFLSAGLLLAVPGAVAQAAVPIHPATVRPAVNSCSENSTVGWHCGYYNGTAETNEWSSNTAAVMEIQDLINQTQLYWENGGPTLAVDGSFGPQTLAAVQWVQRTYGLCGGDNGEVGPCTWAWLRWFD
jgi:peptidoglycan hydrolase-like protein with peptidoglycan-binding domain